MMPTPTASPPEYHLEPFRNMLAAYRRIEEVIWRQT
jgi:hypothetical protein